jgi:radical SAM protein (TIGR01212 family)
MDTPYYSFNGFLKKKFGQRVRKIPIDAGFTCPNKDGTISTEGCVFCDTYGSGPIDSMDRALSITQQIERFTGQQTGMKYIAYYQAHSNTCGPLDILRQQYELIFNYEEIVGLFIGTRPDSIRDKVYPLLEEFNRKTYLAIELGLQSVHAKSLEFLNRNHSYRQFLDTFQKLKERNIDVVVHLIVGIPGETREDMLASVREMNRLEPAGVKFHLLHVLKNTPLYDIYQNKKIKLLEQNEYIDRIILLLEHLDPAIVVHRLTGERDKVIYHAPLWALDKNTTINAIRTKMQAQKTFQGRCLT